MIAVIPDNPSLEGDAINIAYRLRQQGFKTTIAYRGNAKRHAEIARKLGADAALYVRSIPDDGSSRYHLTQLKPDPDSKFLARVLEAVGPGIGGLSGSVPT
jgi:histidyl-tRNA synthetase